MSPSRSPGGEARPGDPMAKQVKVGLGLSKQINVLLTRQVRKASEVVQTVSP